MNNVSLLGRFGKDPELRYFESGSCRANFSLAIDERVKRNGEWVKQVTWVNCEAWGNLASDVIAQYCRKGSQVAVTGKLKVESWQNRETGAKRSKMLVNVRSLYMTGDKNSKANPQQQNQPRPPAPEARAVGVHGCDDYGRPVDDYEDQGGGGADYNEIPF